MRFPVKLFAAATITGAAVTVAGIHSIVCFHYYRESNSVS